jgi:hypothetical protein
MFHTFCLLRFGVVPQRLCSYIIYTKTLICYLPPLTLLHSDMVASVGKIVGICIGSFVGEQPILIDAALCALKFHYLP